MTAFDDAVVSVLVADYIGIDASGKFNVIGLGFQYTAVLPTGGTPPQFALAIVDVPRRYVGAQVSVSLELIDLTDGGSFRMPGPSGKPEALRLEQMFTVEAPTINVPGFQHPGELASRIQVIMGFPNGLPLLTGHRFEWRASVDGQRRKGWVARFEVLRPVPPPVIGGHGGPSEIPNVHVDDVKDDDAVTDE